MHGLLTSLFYPLRKRGPRRLGIVILLVKRLGVGFVFLESDGGPDGIFIGEIIFSQALLIQLNQTRLLQNHAGFQSTALMLAAPDPGIPIPKLWQ